MEKSSAYDQDNVPSNTTPSKRARGRPKKFQFEANTIIYPRGHAET